MNRAWVARRRSSAEALVLTALGSGPAGGYDLQRATRLRPGRLYPALKRLEVNGLVEASWVWDARVCEAIGDDGARRIYALTEVGRQCGSS